MAGLASDLSTWRRSGLMDECLEAMPAVSGAQASGGRRSSQSATRGSVVGGSCDRDSTQGCSTSGHDAGRKFGYGHERGGTALHDKPGLAHHDLTTTFIMLNLPVPCVSTAPGALKLPADSRRSPALARHEADGFT